MTEQVMRELIAAGPLGILVVLVVVLVAAIYALVCKYVGLQDRVTTAVADALVKSAAATAALAAATEKCADAQKERGY